MVPNGEDDQTGSLGKAVACLDPRWRGNRGLAEQLGLPAKCKFTSRNLFQSTQRNICLGTSVSSESTKQSVCVNLVWHRIIVLSAS